MSVRNAKILGSLARKQGKNEGHCPYDQGSLEWNSWVEGFRNPVSVEENPKNKPKDRKHRNPLRDKSATNRRY